MPNTDSKTLTRLFLFSKSTEGRQTWLSLSHLLTVVLYLPDSLHFWRFSKPNGINLLQPQSWPCFRHLLRPLPTWIVLHLTVTHGRPCLYSHFRKTEKQTTRTDKELLDKLEVMLGLLPLLTFKLASAWGVHQSGSIQKEYNQMGTQLLVDSQKHEPCISTYRNEEGKKC